MKLYKWVCHRQRKAKRVKATICFLFNDSESVIPIWKKIGTTKQRVPKNVSHKGQN